MQILKLGKELNVPSKDIMDYLNENGQDIKTPMNSISDELEKDVRKKFAKTAEVKPKEAPTDNKAKNEAPLVNDFKAGDMITCRCVTNGRAIYHSTKTDMRYEWGGFGDETEVDYSDLMRMKSAKSDFLYEPIIMIEDEKLCKLWAKELEDTYKNYSGLDNPAEFFEMYDDDFKSYLESAPRAIKELIKDEAMKLIRAKKFSSLNKLNIIDDVCGTVLKKFI